MRQIDSIRRSSARFDAAVESAQQELARAIGTREAMARPAANNEAIDAIRGLRPLESLGSTAQMEATLSLEAIILEKLRPAYFIREDKIEIKGEYDHEALIVTHKDKLEKVARNVARVDLFNHSTLSYAGTGWMIDKDIAVTNRHVAQIFAAPGGFGAYEFNRGNFGEAMEARLDFVRQVSAGPDRRRAEVTGVLYIAAINEPDIAFLRVETRTDVTPLELFTGRVEDGTPVAAIGYPAWDGERNDPTLMKKLFGGVYDVKRFSPGLVTGTDAARITIHTDYTSLGGNSGSPIIRLDTGQAVGLHFAGTFRDTNYAVASDIVAAARARIKTIVSVGELPVEAPASAPANFAGRDGYNPNFLGAGARAVPLPALGTWTADVAPVSDDGNGRLKYRHFSVIQSASRRLPLLTAVNIDGAKSIRLTREGDWRLDGRLAAKHQIGNELYRNNALDRGHMVRRRDPGWGKTRKEAEEAEQDTFHYTNSAPQHENLNQRDWVGLEDYILENADTKNFKVTVFTGPVFRKEDKRLKAQPGAEGVQIPEEFWKIAVILNSATNKLSATGYVLSQGKMIRDLVEAQFIYGQYKTYQIQIAKIEKATGLNFGSLRNFDPLATAAEAPFGQAARVIEGHGDLQLSPLSAAARAGR